MYKIFVPIPKMMLTSSQHVNSQASKTGCTLARRKFYPTRPADNGLGWVYPRVGAYSQAYSFLFRADSLEDPGRQTFLVHY